MLHYIYGKACPKMPALIKTIQTTPTITHNTALNMPNLYKHDTSIQNAVRQLAIDRCEHTHARYS